MRVCVFACAYACVYIHRRRNVVNIAVVGGGGGAEIYQTLQLHPPSKNCREAKHVLFKLARVIEA